MRLTIEGAELLYNREISRLRVLDRARLGRGSPRQYLCSQANQCCGANFTNEEDAKKELIQLAKNWIEATT